MSSKLRLPFIVVVILLALPAAAVKASARMPVGFDDDPSFRWSNQATVNLAAAAAAHASIIHTLVDWATVAPTRPAHPLNGGDPAYHLADLDALVNASERYDLLVLLTITGTPPWANGGQSQNHPPRNLKDLTQFAQMLASRYNGMHPGLGVVSRFSVWNEPNLGLFLTPQFHGSRIVSPSIYAKLFMAAYTGIKAGNPKALVAAGETSNRGRDKPTGSPGNDSIAPATFAHVLSEVAPKLPFAAWATHPDPSNFAFGPTQKVALPNVSFSTITRFAVSLQKWFKRRVPVWVSEYGEETKPEYAYGVSYAQQAKDMSKVLQLAAANPYIEMFVWFIFRDTNSSTWFSGLEQANGEKKPAYQAFVSAASGIVGKTQTVRPGHPFSVTVPVPFMVYHDPPGVDVGVSYQIQGGGKLVARGQPLEPLQPNESVTFPVEFRPLEGATYTLSLTVSDKHGQIERHVIVLLPASHPSFDLVASPRKGPSVQKR
jgi:hypothetical protein